MLPARTQRRLRVFIAALTVLVVVAGCTTGSGRPFQAEVKAADRPNIVFVLTDDLSSDLVAYMPHVQALEREGATFTNYFVVDSLCCPSRAAIFTGEYPHDTGVFRNAGRSGGYAAFNRHGDQKHTFAIDLQQAGYRTGFMGKYLNLYRPQVDPPAKGWNEWDVTGSEGYKEYRYHLNQNGRLYDYGSQPSDYLTDVLSDKATGFVGSAADSGKPFALEVATFAPHEPFVPARVDLNSFPGLSAPRGPAFDRLPKNPPPWLAGFPPLSAADQALIDDRYRKRVESVQAVDRMVGALEQTLAAKGILRKTYFVFSSDNGFHMGQDRMLPGKQTAFDTDIRVPLVVSGPGIAPGRTIADMASSIDLAPTFEAIADARANHVEDGGSLLPLLHGTRAPPDWQKAILVEHRGPNVAADDPDRQLYRAGNPPSYEAMRTAGALYVEYVTGAREYYDLRRDPLELDNIAGSLSPATLAGLHRQLRALADCHGSTCREAAATA